ncbi:unnamed protein product [Adineta steineri]|uniref:Kinesin light chain n=1 Tax=Adineta steineri TaxID=433720 RepID=A0A818VAB9_9BILA|nr:unnamed protein product [Adineta steineri]CAF3709539.1 unnamed protein product [Adineta steineri]
MPLINNIPQLHSIYIFNDTKILPKTLIKKSQKIKSADINVDDLCQKLQQGIKQYNQDSIAVSFISINEIVLTDNLNQLDPTFMYTQLFKEILLDMEYNSQAIKDFITYCRQNNPESSNNIDRFEKEYCAQSAIWWYTCSSFIYSMLNYALRSMDGDTIINMGFFIHDLHLQIQQLHQQQVNSYHGKSFIVYRGQGLSNSNFEKLKKTKGGLLSFNNFLSTSTNQDIPLIFALSALGNADMVGILFVMSVDPNVKSAPFSSIKELSYFREEDEILFSMHTVFRVNTIKPMDNNNQIYQVELQLTSDDDQQLRLLTDWMREEAGSSTGWRRLGDLLLKMGQLDKIEELYNVLLGQTSDESEKQHYYNQLGCAHCGQGDYDEAIWYFKKATEIQQNSLCSNHPDLATSYNNIGLAYGKMGEYSKALSSHEEALEIREKALRSNHPDLGQSYNNIGLLYNHMGEYSKALSYYKKDLEICQKTLPPNHPHLATSYNNIAGVYYKMDEYSKALSFYEKALEICQKTLPSNHPHLATSYNNIGLAYDTMGEYSKALSSHEKALEIREKTLPANHPDLATSYNNIGLAYDTMGEHPKALSSHEKALEIQENTLPFNHPNFAQSYNNIGSVYYSMKNYSKALLFFEKSLEVYQKSLPLRHPLLATLYNNIGGVYDNMEEYSKAISFYEKAVEIRRKTLPSNHPDLAGSYNNIGSVYRNMKDYSKALPYYERALDILQRALPLTHPHIKIAKDSIEIIKKKL